MKRTSVLWAKVLRPSQGRERWWAGTVTLLVAVALVSGPTSPASGQPTTLSEGQVLSAYAPIVQLHPNESYFPMNATTYLSRMALKWSHGGGCPDHTTVAAGSIDPRKLGQGGYRDKAEISGWPFCEIAGPYYTSANLTRPFDSGNPLPNQPEGYFLRPTNRQRGDLQTAPVYYEYVAQRSVTFWFFYGFNDAPGAGFFNHDGDWERISIQLNSSNHAENVVFYEHNGNCELPWSGSPVQKNRGHPVVYSAIGTHATYPRPGNWPLPFGQTDYASAVGPAWKTYQNERNVHAPWYGYGGAWGQVGSWEFSTGPLGPSRYKLGAPANFNISPCPLTP